MSSSVERPKGVVSVNRRPAGQLHRGWHGFMDRKTLEMLMLSALRKKNFTRAVDLAFTYGYRSAPSISIGLEIWARDVHRLDLIFAYKPAIFASVPDAALEQLRLVAGLWQLLGKKRAAPKCAPCQWACPRHAYRQPLGAKYVPASCRFPGNDGNSQGARRSASRPLCHGA